MTAGELKKFLADNNVPDDAELVTDVWDGDYCEHKPLYVGHPDNSMAYLPAELMLYH